MWRKPTARPIGHEHELLLDQDRQTVFASVFPGILALLPLPIPFALPIKVVLLMVLVTLGSIPSSVDPKREDSSSSAMARLPWFYSQAPGCTDCGSLPTDPTVR